MPNLEILALDTAVPQIRAPGAGDGYSVPRNMTFAASTTLNAQTVNVATLSASLPVFTDASKNLTSNGTVAVTNGGTGATTASTARTNLGATTIGGNFFTLTDPSAITFPRINADNTVSALDAATFRTAIGAGTGSGSVTSVDVSGGTTGLTTSGGPIIGSGTITLAGTLITSNGGTGLSTYTAGDLVYYASGTALTKLAIGASGRYLSSSGTAPQWSAPAALTKTDDTNVTLTLGGSASTALLNAASLTLGWTGQLSVARGGTGASSFTANQVIYGSFSQSSNLTFDGTTLYANQIGGGAF